jgi:cellulose synthase operon protein YhjQ
MSIIGVVSMKGGVGKTSTTANLAAALAAKLGPGRVSVADLDPQNGLHWHFGVHESQTSGICEQSLQDGNWQDVILPSAFDVACLPYGNVSEIERENFEALLLKQPNWIGEQLERAGINQNAVVVIDTPPGPSVYLKQVFACADLILVVLLADAGSYATIPAMETWLDDVSSVRPKVGMYYVLNQVDRSEPLNRDTAAFLHQQLKPRICPIDIHGDEAVGEALAFQQPVLAYEPHAQASLDLDRLATWTINALNK